MLRSLYAGISGMKVNQTKLDVIGNNIANVGTTAFKGSRARFQDMLSQTMKDANSPATNNGGINPNQVGLGVQLAGIDTMMDQGMMQPTNRNLDAAIDGDGYFMVSKGPVQFGNTIGVTHTTGTHTINNGALATAGSEVLYTRDGSFTRDSDGNLLTSDGYRVMGYAFSTPAVAGPPAVAAVESITAPAAGTEGVAHFVDASQNLTADDTSLKSLIIPEKVHDDATNTDLRIRSFSIAKDGTIDAVLEDGRVSALGQIAMSSFKNQEGLKKLGNNLYQDTVNSGEATLRSGVGTAGTNEDNSKGYGDMLQGMLEMSNVDLAQQFTDMIVTTRAFEASGKTITTGDEILQDLINLKR